MINWLKKEKKNNKKWKSEWKSNKKSKKNLLKERLSFLTNKLSKITLWYCKSCSMSTLKCWLKGWIQSSSLMLLMVSWNSLILSMLIWSVQWLSTLIEQQRFSVKYGKRHPLYKLYKNVFKLSSQWKVLSMDLWAFIVWTTYL